MGLSNARHTVPVARGRRVTLADLTEWGEQFGRSLRPPRVVALSGELGSGKTTLVQALCRGYGVESEVTSPTYALVQEYEAPRGSVYHVDLYRLRDEKELTNLGWEDVINSGDLVLIEWAERADRELPADRVRIRLSHVPGDDTLRLLEVD